MNDVPQVKDLLRSLQEENALGECRILARRDDGPLHVVIPRAEESTEGLDFLAETERMPAQASHADRPRRIQNEHIAKSGWHREAVDPFGARKREQRTQVLFRDQSLACQLGGKF